MSRLKDYSRRKFIKLAGIITGSSAIAPILQACGNTPTPTPKTPVPNTPLPSPNPTAAPTATLVPMPAADSYVAIAPKTMRAGQTERISITLFSGQNLTNDNIKVALLNNGQAVAQATGLVQGRGEISLNIPALPDGNYDLQVEGSNFRQQGQIKVEQSFLLLVESDKPIYKPGQMVQLRVLTMDSQLKPLAESVTVEITEAKGSKIFKKEVKTDSYGMASLEMPLSGEPNLGVWKINAVAGKIKTPLDIRVEKYVLPKYQVEATLAKEWVLANEKISGTVKADYTYGKPVQGEVQIVATKYVGTWQEFANVTRNIDGQVSFELPAVNYVAGTPNNSGQGNIQLKITVREKGTGYEESTTRLLTVLAAPLTLKVIPESVTFKPGLPLSLLVTAQTPDKKPVDLTATLQITYSLENANNSTINRQVKVTQGLGKIEITPPSNAISLVINASSGNAYTYVGMQAGYSPSGSFVHLQQVSTGTLKVGNTVSFKVLATKQALSFYYEVVARNKLVFTGYAISPEISFVLTPQMTGSARLLVYQILPNSEVAADYLPFTVEASYPHQIQASFDKTEVEPGQAVNLSVKTDGVAKVGLALVDRSVFILAENRLNLAQVFNELEKLYLKPQVELHAVKDPYSGKIETLSSQEAFSNAGVVVLSNKTVPQGKSFDNPVFGRAVGGAPGGVVPPPLAAAPVATTAAAAATTAPAQAQNGQDALAKADGAGLAEVQRVRQFFPETWLWDATTTDANGKATKALHAPDSITTWMLHAVAMSPTAGLGITQAELKVLQPFFVQLDLVYAAIRGEQFPVKVALYNYTNTPEEFTVELERGNWFDLLDQPSQKVTVNPNDVGGVAFTIRPKTLGNNQLKVTARSKNRADAIVKDLLIEAEGVAREVVENVVVAAGSNYELSTEIPQNIIEGSARAFASLCGNFMTQTIEGLDNLLRMPYGCGEQNMLLFAPNVYVSQYLKESGQIKPEIQAKAESLMMTGYQRELIYRRNDGSFSAFGNSDKEGSLWLSAFVLKTFAQAKGLIYVDDAVLQSTTNWILRNQKSDGSFAPVGFVHHQELLGGLKGNQALTAYITIALLEAGEKNGASKAVGYLESSLPNLNDAYAVAITSYALELAKSAQAGKAYDILLKLGKQGENGYYWGDDEVVVQAAPNQAVGKPQPPRPNASATIETTGYALLALNAHGDRITASRTAQWLVSKRNAYGGWNSTQDTVVGLQAVSKFVAGGKADVNLTVAMRAGNWTKEVKIAPDNADVLQILDAPLGETLKIEVKGKGQAILQMVRRFNVPEVEKQDVSAFKIAVDYGTSQIAVNNQINVKAAITFNPPEQVQAGMVVLDVALPTGFAAVTDTIETLLKQQPKLKRYEFAGRKVVLYIEDMQPQEQLQFEFKAVALYPIKAQAVTSQAYSYYRPAWKGESLGGALVVTG